MSGIEKAHPAARADVLATVAILLAFSLVVLAFVFYRRFSAHPTPEQCEALLERYITHVAHAVDPKPQASALAERRKLARAAADKHGAFAACAEELTMDEHTCGMQAQSADELERCLPVR